MQEAGDAAEGKEKTPFARDKRDDKVYDGKR